MRRGTFKRAFQALPAKFSEDMRLYQDFFIDYFLTFLYPSGPFVCVVLITFYSLHFSFISSAL